MRTDELLDEYRCDHARVRLPAGWSVPGWQAAWAAWASRAPDGAYTLFVRAGWWDRAVPLARRVDELGRVGGWLLGEGFVGPAPAPEAAAGGGREIVAAATAGRWLDADGVLRPHGYAVAEVFFPSGHAVRVDLVSEVADADAARALLAAVAAAVEVVPVPPPAEWAGGAGTSEWPATSDAHAAPDAPTPRRERPVRVRAAGRGARPPARRPDDTPDETAPAAPAAALHPRDDDADALPAPYVRYVPADRFVPEAPDDPRADDPRAAAPAPLPTPAPARTTPPAPSAPASTPTPPRRPSVLLHAAALAPLVAFFLPWFEDPRTVANRWFTLRHAPPRTGLDLAGDAPILWAVPALAVAGMLAVARWRAAPSAGTWRRGVGAAPVAGVAVLALAGVHDVEGSVDIGVVVVLAAWGLQLLEALTFRTR